MEHRPHRISYFIEGVCFRQAQRLTRLRRGGEGCSNVQITQLTALLTDYRTANKAVATTGAALSKAQGERKDIYNARTGSLRAKMKAIKKAVSSQYTRTSNQYAEVKSIAL